LSKKVALCLHGYFGTLSTQDFSTSKIGLQHLKDNVFSKHENVDVYVHSWQPEYKQEILKFYKPIKSIFEEQIDFKNLCLSNNIHQNYIDEYFPRSKTMYCNATAERILSFYYSRCESLKLCFDKQYDCVITTRFDISARGGDEVKNIRYNPDYDMNYLYTSNWNQKNIGYADMWFYGSQEIMTTYCKIYKDALKDFSVLSEYEKTLTSAWPDSNFYNHDDFNDPRQFTNEIDNKIKSNNLMFFPKWRLTDSHLHHKWFCINNKLYERTKWI